MLNNEFIELNGMPLYWRIKDSALDEHQEISGVSDFTCYYDNSMGLVKQKVSVSLANTLNTIYKEEFNVGYLQDDHTMSKGYGEDLMSFIEKTLNKHTIDTILEIGCGGCYILEKLNSKGYDVVGIDPSPIAFKNGEKKNLNVINDFYPSKKYDNKVDMIFHADVLEHVDNPVEFLKLQHNGLNDGGLLIVSVPDCTESIELGDISMFLHQHINYFDKASLGRVVEKAGFKVVALEKAGYGGSLYCSAVKEGNQDALKFNGTFEVCESNYFAKSNKNIIRFKELVQKVVNDKKTVGFYMPLRAAPYLSILDGITDFRLFDDTAHWYGKYLDGLNMKIENFEDLKKNPVDILFIMSLTFGEVVKNKIENSKIGDIDILTLRNMLDEK